MARPSPSPSLLVLAAIAAAVCLAQPGAAALKVDYYASTCPNVEAIVRGVVQQKMQATIRTIGSTIRLFFHDCFVEVRVRSPSLHRLQQRDFLFFSKIDFGSSERPREPGRRRRMCA